MGHCQFAKWRGFGTKTIKIIGTTSHLGFESVVLLFDADEAGLKAAEAAAGVACWHGQNSVCQQRRQPVLLDGMGGEIINAIHQARDYRPDSWWQLPITVTLLVWMMLPHPLTTLTVYRRSYTRTA